NELVDTTAGMSNSDMLQLQLNKFHEVMRENLRRPGAKVVFIHGKGEGVLRKALLDELRRKYPRCEAQDASFREYGFGATLVKLHP
ncbi:MAG: Smr/MutS family protein, partial [Muribaculaceae bacterium]